MRLPLISAVLALTATAAVLADEPADIDSLIAADSAKPAISDQQPAPSAQPDDAAASQPSEVERSRQLIKELRRGGFQAPQTQESDLARTARELLSMEVRPREAAVSPKLPTQPTATGPATASAPVEPAPKLTPEMAARLAALAKNAADASDVADELFAAGQYEAAGILYEITLKDTKHPDAAWLLAQLARCRQEQDPAAAAALNQRLRAEHGNSPWTAVAQARGQWFAWKQAYAGVKAQGAAPASSPASAPAAAAAIASEAP